MSHTAPVSHSHNMSGVTPLWGQEKKPAPAAEGVCVCLGLVREFQLFAGISTVRVYFCVNLQAQERGAVSAGITRGTFCQERVNWSALAELRVSLHSRVNGVLQSPVTYGNSERNIAGESSESQDLQPICLFCSETLPALLLM